MNHRGATSEPCRTPGPFQEQGAPMADRRVVDEVSLRIRPFLGGDVSRDGRVRRCARCGGKGRPVRGRCGSARVGRSAQSSQVDRQRELRESGGVAGDGQLAERQVRGGKSRSSSLRGLRQRRRHRVARPTSSRARCSERTTPMRSRTAGSTPTLSLSGRCCPNEWSHLRWRVSGSDT